jgi:hypothetical protein
MKEQLFILFDNALNNPEPRKSVVKAVKKGYSRQLEGYVRCDGNPVRSAPCAGVDCGYCLERVYPSGCSNNLRDAIDKLGITGKVTPKEYKEAWDEFAANGFELNLYTSEVEL